MKRKSFAAGDPVDESENTDKETGVIEEDGSELDLATALKE